MVGSNLVNSGGGGRRFWYREKYYSLRCPGDYRGGVTVHKTTIFMTAPLYAIRVPTNLSHVELAKAVLTKVFLPVRVGLEGEFN